MEKKPELRCRELQLGGPVYLHEVGLCLEHDGITFRDCPSPLTTNDRAVRLCRRQKIHCKCDLLLV